MNDQFRKHRLVFIPAAITALAVLASSCSSGGHSPSQAKAPTTSTSTSTTTQPSATTTTPLTSNFVLPQAVGNTKPYWLMEQFSVAPLVSAGLSTTLLQKFFNNPQTFVIIKENHPAKVALLPDATYVMSFANFQTLQEAFSAGSIPSYVKDILYDNEKWPATPVNEQQQPFTYAAQARGLAHAHGMGLIFTPAANLSLVLSKSYQNATKYQGYLTLGIASQSARVADVVEIQAQQAETSSTFSTFVPMAVSQVKAANPLALVLLGLTTQVPGGQAVTSQTLLNDYNSTRSLVSGYWLNIPGGQGGPENPGGAVSFLEALAPQLGY